eukprot:TRINITY_DN66673_c0_g1_i1.p1 TRINITY_DN66673_c0_g1~~TRINITY_DN66673_c0_g1_i1.p1  ORF type:complete len:197 (+),score=25.84 TRINITY_DN66673_c0_g1_i1:29-592(+)
MAKIQEKVSDEELRLQARHALLDRAFLLSLLLALIKFGQPKVLLKKLLGVVTTFPLHYKSQFDWKRQPMDKFVGMATMLAGWWFLVKTYVIERDVVRRAHKKYAAHNNKLAVAMHGTGSAIETTLGCFACCYPEHAILTKMSSALAINNVITGFVLTPGVFGIKLDCAWLLSLWLAARHRDMEDAPL